MIELLKQVPLFSGLTDDQLIIVSSITSRLEFNPNTVLFEQGDTIQYFCIIIRGSVKIYISNREGQQIILSTLHAGDSFNALALIAGQPRSSTIETMEETILLTITNDNFHLLLRTHFDIVQNLMLQLNNHLRARESQVYDLTFLEPSARVIKHIVRLAQQQGKRVGDSILVDTPFDREYISGLSGVHPAELNDILQQLEREQVILLSPNQYTLDVTRLYASQYVN
ncbi:Crp/Fnr family transcriptional regulator [Paenibacillus marinisediminis]